MNAANRPHFRVDEADVPAEIRTLIPAVERWAIPCDVTRGDYFDHQPDGDISQFWYEVLPYESAVNSWLSSLPRDVSAWPEAAIHFMYMLKAHDEAWRPTDEERRHREKRLAEFQRKNAIKLAISTALKAFGVAEYGVVIELLAPFEGDLDKVTKAKLAFARKRSGAK